MFKLLNPPSTEYSFKDSMVKVVPSAPEDNLHLYYAKRDNNIVVYNERTNQLFSMETHDLKSLYKSVGMFKFSDENRCEVDGIVCIKEDALPMLYKHGVGPAEVKEHGTLRKAIKANYTKSIELERARIMSSYEEIFILLSETEYIILLLSEVMHLIINILAYEDVPIELGLIAVEFRHGLPKGSEDLNCELEVIHFGNVFIVPSSHFINIVRRDFLDASLTFKSLQKVDSGKDLILSNAVSDYMDGLYVANIESDHSDNYGHSPECIFGYKEDLGVKIYFPKEFMTVSKYQSEGKFKFFLDWKEVKEEYISLSEIPVRTYNGEQKYLLNIFNFASQEDISSISDDPLI